MSCHSPVGRDPNGILVGIGSLFYSEGSSTIFGEVRERRNVPEALGMGHSAFRRTSQIVVRALPRSRVRIFPRHWLTFFYSKFRCSGEVCRGRKKTLHRHTRSGAPSCSQAAPLLFLRRKTLLRQATYREVCLLYCQVCSRNPIQAPSGSTSGTRFTCRFCINRIWRHRQQVRIRRNVEEHLPEPIADELLAESVLDAQSHEAHEECAISGD
jgi:hypothetical protein